MNQSVSMFSVCLVLFRNREFSELLSDSNLSEFVVESELW